MERILAPVIFSFLCGTLVVFQSTFNSQVGKVMGPSQANFITHFGGLLFIVGILISGITGGAFKNWITLPWYYYTGGIMGAMILYSFIFSIPRLGMVVASGIFIGGQLLASMIFDHFGLFGLEKLPITFTKFIGLALLFVGSLFILKK